MSWLAPHADEENCYLTTIGRRSSNPHEVEIWFGVDGDTLYLISGNGPGADWYRNALATPAVSMRVAGETRAGVASDVSDAAERQRVGERRQAAPDRPGPVVVLGDSFVVDEDACCGAPVRRAVVADGL